MPPPPRDPARPNGPRNPGQNGIRQAPAIRRLLTSNGSAAVLTPGEYHFDRRSPQGSLAPHNVGRKRQTKALKKQELPIVSSNSFMNKLRAHLVTSTAL